MFGINCLLVKLMCIQTVKWLKDDLIDLYAEIESN